MDNKQKSRVIKTFKAMLIKCYKTYYFLDNLILFKISIISHCIISMVESHYMKIMINKKVVFLAITVTYLLGNVQAYDTLLKP